MLSVRYYLAISKNSNVFSMAYIQSTVVFNHFSRYNSLNNYSIPYWITHYVRNHISSLRSEMLLLYQVEFRVFKVQLWYTTVYHCLL